MQSNLRAKLLETDLTDFTAALKMAIKQERFIKISQAYDIDAQPANKM